VLIRDAFRSWRTRAGVVTGVSVPLLQDAGLLIEITMAGAASLRTAMIDYGIPDSRSSAATLFD